MLNRQLIQVALERLLDVAGIQAFWEPNKTAESDGSLMLEWGGQQLTYRVNIKRELRSHQIPALLQDMQNHGPLLVVAQRIFPRIKEQLRKDNIAYLETCGNVFIQQKNQLIWLDGQRPLVDQTRKRNRALTKAGLKLLFHLLQDPALIRENYRAMAQRSQIALASVNQVIRALRTGNFLLEERPHVFQLHRVSALLQKWLEGYEDRLKPSLFVGNFRFLHRDSLLDWHQINLDPSLSQWGGEPAGYIYTRNLQPQVLTLYTTMSRADFMRTYQLIPDPTGPVHVYQKFWKSEPTDPPIVPTLLAYTDLMNSSDRRCLETAQKIFHDHLSHLS